MHQYTIETPRLLLRPLTIADVEAEFVWLSDPEGNRFMPYNLYTSVEQVQAWLLHVETVDSTYHFGVVRKDDGVLIGAGDIGPGEETVAWGLGYNFRRSAWNQGYGTEAAMAMIRFAYNTFGVRDFAAAHAVGNPASGRVMEHCGMVLDHFGQYSRFDGSEAFEAKYYRLRLDRDGHAQNYHFVPMTRAQFETYLHWRYPEPYTFYNTPESGYSECLQEYLDAPENWFTALDCQGQMAGICDVSFHDGVLEIGLGLSPEHTGQGAGEQFVRTCIAFVRDRFDWHRKPIALRVADFNRRAIKIYERIGFTAAGLEHATSFGTPVIFIKMVLAA